MRPIYRAFHAFDAPKAIVEVFDCDLRTVPHPEIAGFLQFIG
jgi:hypothetical protein